MKVLIVDNYDSFTYNLVQYLGELGAELDVVRNDRASAEELVERGADRAVVSPGPCTPDEAGVSVEAIPALAQAGVPVLGVCLGHQAIAAAYGAIVERAPELLHGKTSQVEHEGAGVLAGLPSPFTATRYHSLSVREGSLPDQIEVTARTSGGVIMALRHRDLPLEGVQFHPESVLTEGGHRLLANWLVTCGDADAVSRSHGLAPVVPAP
jgi:para-aminobenzoate synthetase component II